MTIPTVPEIQVLLQNRAVKTVPYSTGIYLAPDTSVTLVWTARPDGVTFPEQAYFEWKSGTSHPAGVPNRSPDGKSLILTYTMPASREVWEYTIWVQNRDGIFGEDPEVDNRPPAGSGDGDDDDQGKHKP